MQSTVSLRDEKQIFIFSLLNFCVKINPKREYETYIQIFIMYIIVGLCEYRNRGAGGDNSGQ